MNNEETIFADGMYFNEPSDKAPDFIKGSISVEPKRFTEWMREHYNKDEKYIRIDLKISKAGKPYTSLSTFKPNKGQQSGNNASQGRSEPSGNSFNPNQGSGQDSEIPF